MMQQTNGSGIMSKLGESGNQKEKNATFKIKYEKL